MSDSNNRQIKIFDTTLRDGQQCPGAGMGFEQNLAYARLAMEVGVDVLEAGFPSASKTDREIVEAIVSELASQNGSPIIAGLCQLREDQVDITIEALSGAVKYKKARLHTYVPVDPVLMEASLGERAKDKAGIQRDVFNFIKKASSAGLEVEFSPEGYSRMGENFDFVTDLIRAAIEGGASVMNCPDTIGGGCEYEGEDYFVNRMSQHAAIMAKEFPGREVIWSAHCHNDFGLAAQNSINAVFRGPARQIEGCFGGVGERAGNVALEQCIILLKHFAKRVDPKNPFFTNIKTEKIQAICDFVNKNMLPCQPHWPICGANAAKHSSGGHTNAILRNPMAYQAFDPAEVGKEVSIVFGPLSGGNHAKSIIQSQGYVCADGEKTEVTQFIKDLFADRRRGITDEELLRGYFEYRSPIKVEKFDYSRSANKSSIHIEGQFFDEQGEITEAHQGSDSALAALVKAVEKKFGPIQIQSYRSESDGQGINARSLSTIVMSCKDNFVVEGKGLDSDIEISAMKALINAVNKAYIELNYKA